MNTRTRGEDPRYWHEWPDGKSSVRIGKHDAGRFLDGVEIDQYPELFDWERKQFPHLKEMRPGFPREVAHA